WMPRDPALPPPPPPPGRGGGSTGGCAPPPRSPRVGGEGRGGGAPQARVGWREHLPCPHPPTLPRTRGREQERVHENHPCSIQWPCSPGGAKAQARWPCEVSMT